MDKLWGFAYRVQVIEALNLIVKSEIILHKMESEISPTYLKGDVCNHRFKIQLAICANKIWKDYKHNKLLIYGRGT